MSTVKTSPRSRQVLSPHTARLRHYFFVLLISSAVSENGEWKVGITDYAYQYLTAETFSHKVSISGGTIRKRQVWTLKQEFIEDCVFIRSHLNFYITSDKYGNVACTEEEKTDDAKFNVEYSEDGKWAFRHVITGHYLSSEDNAVVKCFNKSPEAKTWWNIQLYIHPQINLINVQRKCYVHLNEDVLECTELIPWGSDSTVMLDFVEGKYSIRSCDNRYLSRDGTLQENCDDNSRYSMEVHSGALVFKHLGVKYLSVVDKSQLKAIRKELSKDELFTIENSHPQVMIVSHNNIKVSYRQGIDVSTNQNVDDLQDTEIFQLEYDMTSGKWAVRTNNNRFWSYVPATGGIQINSEDRKGDLSLFSIVWQEDSTVGIKVSDGKYLSSKLTEAPLTSSPALEEEEIFKVIIVNRPLLVLKCEYGFIGTGPKGPQEKQYVCNKLKYDTLQLNVTCKDKWSYSIKGAYGFWGLNDKNCVSVVVEPSEFWFELVSLSTTLIRGPNRQYLKCERSGLLKSVASREEASRFEY